MRKRFLLAAQEYISSDKIAKMLFALISGKRIDDINVIAEVIGKDKDLVPILFSKLRKIVETSPSCVSENSVQLLNDLERAIMESGVIVVLSGPSAVGKDQMAMNCIDNLESCDISAECLTKHGTRRTKPGEKPVNATHLDRTTYYSHKTLQDMRRSPEVFYTYQKYQHWYGFSSNQLNKETQPESPQILFIVFGAVQKHKEFLLHLKRETTRKILSTLLTAEEQTLWLRQMIRTFFTNTERMIRIAEMRKDIDYIERHKEELLSQFDLVLDNGAYHSIGENQNKITRLIRTFL